MQPIIRHLVVDHARRTWPLWILGSFGFIASDFEYFGGRTELWLWLPFLIGGMGQAAALARKELQYLPSRSDLSLLPLSASELGPFLWWARIGFPGLIITVLNLLVFVCADYLGYGANDFWTNVIWILTPWAILGLQLFAPAFNREDSTWLWIFIALPLLMFAAAALQPTTPAALTSLTVIVLFGVCAAGYAYVRPESFVLPAETEEIHQSRGVANEASHQAMHSRYRATRWIAFAAKQLLHPLTLGSLLFLASALVINRQLHRPANFLFAWETPALLVIASTSHLTMRLLLVRRQLQVLPVSMGRLAAILYAVAVTPILLALAPVFTGLVTVSPGLSGAVVTVIVLSLLYLPFAIVVRCVDRLYAILGFVAMGIVAPIFAMYFSHIPSWTLPTVVVMSLAAGYEWTRRALAKGARDTLRDNRHDLPSVF